MNMLDRTFEHVEGALSAYVTGSMASAEVIARTSVEAALNVRYILAGDKLERLRAYFHFYFEKVDKDVKNWLNLTAKMRSRPTGRRDI